MCVCVCVCVCACVRACVRACGCELMRACMGVLNNRVAVKAMTVLYTLT